uniref:Uncharacterized protein n=1 Tax=Globisporangium ultimum (strain ATCC 200006 / CBS 805.95 / DAOM BR144) TaxID=431595 RepID=K3W8H2_GLOUD
MAATRSKKGETLSTRLRAQVKQSASAAAPTTTQWNDDDLPDDATAPVPLLYFYKYLQPIADTDRKLRLNVPITVVVERKDSQEDVLWLRTDAATGFVVKEERSAVPWRKKLHSDLVSSSSVALVAESSASSSSLNNADDEVIAVRNVAHWKNGSNNKSTVLTMKTFDTIVNAPSELASSIQQFVRCRGSHASIYRVFWSIKESKCFAVNIVNDTYKTSDAAEVVPEGPRVLLPPSGGLSKRNLLGQQERSVLDVTMHKLKILSQFYCVSSTSDAKKCHRMPKIRGNPIAEGVTAAKRIVEHVQAQLPGIRFDALAADFIKSSDGTWWFIRVVDFDAHYRVEVPQEVLYLPESVTQIHELMRSKYFRCSLHSHAPVPPGLGNGETLNGTAQECFLCGSLCEFSKAFIDELYALLKGGQTHDDSHGGVLTELATYRMTRKMAVDTIYLLRQRGVLMPTWESAIVSLRKTPIEAASEFTVCFLCYRIFKQQQKLHDIALELHGVFNAISGIDAANQTDISSKSITSMTEGRASSDIFDLTFTNVEVPPPLSFQRIPTRTLLDQIHAFQNESCSVLNSGSVDERHTLHAFSAVQGDDVDPTCTQMRLVFFFHELQDGGPNLVPTEFYLEYQLGQVFNRLYLEGSKCHTPNRWQLCETRIHYFCATFDAFADFCLEKRLLIKMKTVDGDAFHGCTVLSFRPLINAAKRFGNSLLPESRTDYLVEIRTDAYGLLTLKLTLGLLVDSAPFGHVREILSGKAFLREEPMGVYWPPPTFCFTGLAVPRDWVGALMPSEYISGHSP